MRRSTVNQDPELTELTCHSRCQVPDHLSYIWYKNREEVGQGKVFRQHPINSADRYYCALSRYKDSPSPSVCEFTSLFFTKIMWWKVSTTQLRESLIQFDLLSIFTSSSETSTFFSVFHHSTLFTFEAFFVLHTNRGNVFIFGTNVHLD